MQDWQRQVAHWRSATRRLGEIEELASPEAWRGLEGYLGLSLRRTLGDAVGRLQEKLDRLEAKIRQGDAAGLEDGIQDFRVRYGRVESVVDFYVDALNTRSSPKMGALLRACDWMASESMRKVLVPLGVARPPVLVYVDKGFGAAILKAGLRLWDGGTENPAAAIRVAMHNIVRPTALVHETGHQVAHLTGWTEELAGILRENLDPEIAVSWASWASEIAADVYAFSLCGYASVMALHDVLDGGREMVLNVRPGDVHPVPYLRVLLGFAYCEAAYGSGPWNAQADTWRRRYGQYPEARETDLIQRSIEALPKIAKLTLAAPLKAFARRSPCELLRPDAVSPVALRQLEAEAGGALWQSGYFARQEALRMVALAGWRIGLDGASTPEWLARQEEWMIRLGKEWMN
jgi:hypothetical protein